MVAETRRKTSGLSLPPPSSVFHVDALTSPPVSADAAFFVWNGCEDYNNRRNFSVVLRLPGRPTVGELRRAIADHMKRPPART